MSDNGHKPLTFPIRIDKVMIPLGPGRIVGHTKRCLLVQFNDKPTTPCGIPVVHAIPKEHIEVIRE